MHIAPQKIGNTKREVVYNTQGTVGLSQCIETSGDFVTLAIDCSEHTHNVQVFDAITSHSSVLLPSGTDAVVLHGLNSVERKFQIALLTADCAPVSFASSNGDIVGLLHGGRQGVSTGILENFLQTLQSLQLYPATFFVQIGPMIGEYYEFQAADIDEHFQSMFQTYRLNKQTYMFTQDGKTFFKLRKLIVDVLEKLGFKKDYITIIEYDTNNFINTLPSHRLHMLTQRLLQKAKEQYQHFENTKEHRKKISETLYLTKKEKEFFESDEFEFFITRKRMLTCVRT